MADSLELTATARWKERKSPTALKLGLANFDLARDRGSLMLSASAQVDARDKLTFNDSLKSFL